jgi:hypothetical protein
MKSNLKICLDILRCPNTCRHCERVPGGGHYSLSLAEIRAMVETSEYKH